jgi:hypothetical protein
MSKPPINRESTWRGGFLNFTEKIHVHKMVYYTVKLGYNELGYNELGYNELDYNELGYNEHSVITSTRL